MLVQLSGSTLVLIGLALVFDFLNGFHDSSNIVATMISSRAIGLRRALLIVAAAEAAGPFLFGVAVARTIGNDIIADVAVTLPVITAALAGAVGWSLFTGFFGVPSSSSHALLGGLAGAAIAGYSLNALKWAGLGKILFALLISPLLGLLAGYLLMKATLWLARGATPRINVLFKYGQLLTALSLALAASTLDAQKAMGVITLGLVASGTLAAFDVPLWVIGLSAAVFALGAVACGWRLLHVLGAKFYTIRPVHGFTAQTASLGVALGAVLIGTPISLTQLMSSSILGVGSAERVSKVRWGIARQIVAAWLLTIPLSGLLAAGVYAVIH